MIKSLRDKSEAAKGNYVEGYSAGWRDATRLLKVALEKRHPNHTYTARELVGVVDYASQLLTKEAQ